MYPENAHSPSKECSKKNSVSICILMIQSYCMHMRIMYIYTKVSHFFVVVVVVVVVVAVCR